jgi:serine/threonine-protein kinase RsbW
MDERGRVSFPGRTLSGCSDAAGGQETSVPLATPRPMNFPRDLGSHPLTEIAIPSDPVQARRVQDDIEQQLKAQHCGERELFGIKLALEEALVNAIKHGNQMDRTKTVRIAYRVTAERFDIHISDEGPGFDPADVPDPTAFENLERPCGRGLWLMRAYMTDVQFSGGGNAVYMSKLLRNGK